MALRKKYESKREEVTRDWRKLHSEELHHLHPLKLQDIRNSE
jgi:hypothetical protein